MSEPGLDAEQVANMLDAIAVARIIHDKKGELHESEEFATFMHDLFAENDSYSSWRASAERWAAFSQGCVNLITTLLMVIEATGQDPATVLTSLSLDLQIGEGR